MVVSNRYQTAGTMKQFLAFCLTCPLVMCRTLWSTSLLQHLCPCIGIHRPLHRTMDFISSLWQRAPLPPPPPPPPPALVDPSYAVMVLNALGLTDVSIPSQEEALALWRCGYLWVVG